MLRWLGRIFLLLALVVLVADLYAYFQSGSFRLSALGEWWFWIHKDSLQVLQPAVERHISVTLYESVIQPLLEWPLAVELGVLGAIFWLLGRRRH